jgi:hypothetical protein
MARAITTVILSGAPVNQSPAACKFSGIFIADENFNPNVSRNLLLNGVFLPNLRQDIPTGASHALT